MIDKVMMTLCTVLPLGGAAFALFKYAFKQLMIIKNEAVKKSIPITSLIKIIFSLLGGIYGAVASISCFLVFWIPGFKLPEFLAIITLIPLLLLIIAFPILIGWSKAIEAGASSIKGVSKQVKDDIKTKTQIDKPQEDKWQRKPDAEIAQIKKQLKKSSYSPVMPTGVFIVVFATLHVFLNDTSNGTILTVISSIISFCLTYSIQIVKGRSLVNQQKHKICNKCYKEDNIGLTTCFCGGIYEPQEFYIPKEASSEV